MSKLPHGAVRTALIGYGAAALTFLWVQSGLLEHGSASSYVVAGLAVQVLLLAASALIKGRAPDADSEQQALSIVELVADGATVLLFAAGTLSAIAHRAAAL